MVERKSPRSPFVIQYELAIISWLNPPRLITGINTIDPLEEVA